MSAEYNFQKELKKSIFDADPDKVDREELLERMHQNIPIGIFSGRHITYELEFFALQSVRSRLNLKIEEELTKEKLSKHIGEIEPVFLFAQEKSIRQWADADEIIRYIKKNGERELILFTLITDQGTSYINDRKQD